MIINFKINAKYKSCKLKLSTLLETKKLPNFVYDFIPKITNISEDKCWSNKEQSLLIESLIINVPIKPITLIETQDNQYEIIDGQKRVNAINNFYHNRFKLKGLDLWTELNGLTLEELPFDIRRWLDRLSISMTIIFNDSKFGNFSQDKLKSLIRERINLFSK